MIFQEVSGWASPALATVVPGHLLTKFGSGVLRTDVIVPKATRVSGAGQWVWPHGPTRPLLVPADELQCACDVPYCSMPTCTGKVCFVSKRKEEGVITQHRGCFSHNIPENCQAAVMEQYGMRCCDSSMCNAELEIFLQGAGPRARSRSRGRGAELRVQLEMGLGLQTVLVFTQHLEGLPFPGGTGPLRCPHVSLLRLALQSCQPWG